MVYTKPLKKSKPVKITKVGQYAPKSTHPQLVTNQISFANEYLANARWVSMLRNLLARSSLQLADTKKDDASNLVY